MDHLFQNRYKSIVVEEEPYFLELRYLHLNPLRAHVVRELRALDRYPWTGHSALLGTVPRPWQATGEIFAQFGRALPRARRAYRRFIAAGIPRGRRPELQGGGLLRSQGGWAAVGTLRRGREAYLGDARSLGGSAFVEQVRRELRAASPPPARRLPLAELIARVCAATGSHPTALHQGSRREPAAGARERIAYPALEVEGYAGRTVADLLGVHPVGLQGSPARAGCPHPLGAAPMRQRNIKKQRILSTERMTPDFPLTPPGEVWEFIGVS